MIGAGAVAGAGVDPPCSCRTAATSAWRTGRTSKFWAEIFGQRRIYPDLNALMVCRREGAVAGAGDNPQGSLDREQASAFEAGESAFVCVRDADAHSPGLCV